MNDRPDHPDTTVFVRSLSIAAALCATFYVYPMNLAPAALGQDRVAVLTRDQAALERGIAKGNGLVIGGRWIIDHPITLTNVSIVYAEVIVGAGCLTVFGHSYFGHTLFTDDDSDAPCVAGGSVLTFGDAEP